MKTKRSPSLPLSVLLASVLAQAPTLAVDTLPAGMPVAVVDLTTAAGVDSVAGEWRYSDTRIVEVDHRAPGADGQPTGQPIRTYDLEPHAGAADFDDSSWPVIDPTTLDERRSTGRLCFNWYRFRFTVPDRIGAVPTRGATVVFETALDDYAEVWVDGELSRALGQSGGSVIAGWNAPNRLVVGRNISPGQQIQLAILGINGPISNAPANFIWMREAKLEIFPDSTVPLAVVPQEVNVEVLRLAPEIDRIVGPNPKIWKLAEGFLFTEGPVWVPGLGLLLSDPNRNTIYRYSQSGELSVFRPESGYSGPDIAEYGQPGSNGLALDPRGRLTINEHGNRRVTRLEADGSLTVLADRYRGQRLNSPNDLVYRSDGALFFSDPPFGLPKFFEDPRKELPWSGVYLLRNGSLELLTKELTGPNGLALSPDEKTLYVGNWDEKRKVVMQYPVHEDGTVGSGEVLFDMTAAAGEDAIDGIKVDRAGNLYVSGPGGLWVLSAAGEHLGTIRAPRHVHNMAWGDEDRQTLYLCARGALYRMRLGIAGAGSTS